MFNCAVWLNIWFNWINSDVLEIGMDYSYLKALLIGLGNKGVVQHLIYFNFNKFYQIYEINLEAKILIKLCFYSCANAIEKQVRA